MQLDEVKIVPRPRKHTSPATLQREVTLDAQLLQGLFHVRQEEAAEQLGVCLTSFKAACRRLGIQRWPYTKGTSSQTRQREYKDKEELRTDGQRRGEAPVPVCWDTAWLEWYMDATDMDPVIFFSNAQPVDLCLVTSKI
ncbi:hypothetical protein GUITHDRAFT_111243 [Guillardia theta CCMP2712]|uniref:RWP-RK domain-containing protein n=1 Tax=Guillardia theta (strain CCMP2712) TaxID=905079 RepID=L1J3K1_GUITC|nr:hypothetical protein GUITHDRAFT_111243 [Guillardia theta CCMP2712]EKX42877.1 hypothetical protein GUITHDRAFT_111243 [Guillardia theta CCMP2712]|eukprot:XP_005829857.1 hypothetical protein GUITHDRAFT_111243 [Guillardia theta CCMP2712]